MGNLTGSLAVSPEDGRLQSIVQVQPFHAYFTDRRLAFFAMGSLRVTGQCALVGSAEEAAEGERILLGDKVHSKQNVFFYITSQHKLVFAGLRNAECQVLAKVVIHEQLADPLVLQLGFHLLVWPDRARNEFIAFDLKCSLGSHSRSLGQKRGPCSSRPGLRRSHARADARAGFPASAQVRP